jgi:hypothetical protein
MAGTPEYLRGSVVFEEPRGRTAMNGTVDGYRTNYKVLCFEWGIMLVVYVGLFRALKNSPEQPRISN